MTKPAVSIIIPHLNQPVFLQQCLMSLSEQAFEISQVEIIVVDNGSGDIPNEICQAFCNVRLLSEKIAGPGPARNTGIAASQADILAFIDADCIADKNWLVQIMKSLQPESRKDVIGGSVKVSIEFEGRPSMVEAYEQVFSFQQRNYIERKGFSATLNLAMRRSAFDEVGPFGGIDIAEDRNWGQRAARLGIKTHYIEEMIVIHPARKSLREIYAKWDRLLSHDFETQAATAKGRLFWFTKAIALSILSPLSVVTVLRTKNLQSGRERFLALIGNIFIRLYRTRKMLRLQFGRNRGQRAHAWNRK